MSEFDFGFTSNGDIVLDTELHDIKAVTNHDLKLQQSINRIKSISHNWFYDEVGADLEELIGKSIKDDIASFGSDKILNVLTFDGLWVHDDIHIQSEIKNKQHILYTIYFRILDEDTKEERAIELTLSLDLVKGVKIKYGW